MKERGVILLLGTLVLTPREKYTSEQIVDKLNYQVSEYKKQELFLIENIKREQIELSNYISSKITKLDAISEILDSTVIKRNELEETLESIRTAIKNKI